MYSSYYNFIPISFFPNFSFEFETAVTSFKLLMEVTITIFEWTLRDTWVYFT